MKSTRPWHAALVALLSPVTLVAQSTAPYEGNWTAKFNIANGTQRVAKVTFTGGTGSWQVNATNPNDSCLGKAWPLKVTATAADSISVGVSGSSLVAGCPDFSVDFKLQEDRSYLGQFQDGRKVVLVR